MAGVGVANDEGKVAVGVNGSVGRGVTVDVTTSPAGEAGDGISVTQATAVGVRLAAQVGQGVWRWTSSTSSEPELPHTNADNEQQAHARQ
jgi:hypothetical protein